MPWRSFPAPVVPLDPSELVRRSAALLAARPDVVTRAALLDAGTSRSEIDWGLERGRLHRVHRGVYALGRPQLDPAGRAWAAIAACGVGTVLGDHSAAAIYGMIEAVPEPLAVTTTGGTKPRGVVSRRVKHAPPGLILDGLPLLAPHQVLIELSATRSQVFLARALAEAEVLRLVDHERLAEQATGLRRVRPLLELLEDGPRGTLSGLEDLALPILLGAGFRRPAVNPKVLGTWRVDFLWEAEKVVLEVDSWTYHATRSHYERDGTKQLDLELAGYTVVRATRRQLEREPLKVVARLARHLRTSSEVAGPRPGAG